MSVKTLLAASTIVAATTGAAYADKLDDIISAGEIRCGIMLDAPPVGLRDNDNNPIGYDVEVCKDMAAALGVDAVIVETPSPDRIPSLLSDRVDVSISSAGNSLERAKSISFSIPYQVWDQSIAVAASDESITGVSALEGKTIGTLRGSTGEAAFLKDLSDGKWSGAKTVSFGSNAEQFLALNQGKVDAIIEGTAILNEYQKGPGEGKIKIATVWEGGPIDYAGIMVKRADTGFLNWINLFVWHQVKDGRIDALYKQWFGYPAPNMSLDGVGSY